MDDVIIHLRETEDDSVVERAIEEQCLLLYPHFKFENISAKTKGQLSGALVYRLNQETTSDDLTESCAKLLRILSRDGSNIDSLFNKQIIEALANIAGYMEDPVDTMQLTTVKAKAQIEAKKCLSNANFHSANIRDNFLNLHSFPSICAHLTFHSENTPNADLSPQELELNHERLLFDLRCFFILTARCPALRRKSYREYGSLEWADRLIGKMGADMEEKKNVALIGDVLKALFNVASGFRNDTLLQSEEKTCNSLTVHCRDLLFFCHTADSLPPQSMDLSTNIINLLTVMPPNCYELLTCKVENQAVPALNGKDMRSLDVILQVLEIRTESLQTDDKDLLIPVLSLLIDLSRRSKLYRKYLRSKVLPPLGNEVHARPEEGNSLRNKVVRLMGAIGDISQLSAHLLYELCKRSVDRLIKYTGYGNAAGLLANYGLLMGDPYREASSESEHSDTEEYENLKPKINPVSGCVEDPRPSPMDGMSEEQKEYEAMKLVNKIDELMKHGVIKPAAVGEDGRVKEMEHVLEMQRGIETPDTEEESD